MSNHPRRRARRSLTAACASTDYLPITGLFDAITEAWAMHQRFERCVAALVLEPEGAILAAWALTEDRCRDIDAVLDLALTSAIDAPPGSGVLLISAVGDDPVYADEDTLRRYVECCDKVEAVGLTLRDWVLANGEAMHSLRVTMSPHLTEPPELTRGPGWP